MLQTSTPVKLDIILTTLVQHSLLSYLAQKVASKPQLRGDSHISNCASLTLRSIDEFIDRLRAYKFAMSNREVQAVI